METLIYEEELLKPDVSHLVTEEDAPVDSWISEKQMRLFTNILHASWKPGQPFVAAAGVGLFNCVTEPAVVAGHHGQPACDAPRGLSAQEPALLLHLGLRQGPGTGDRGGLQPGRFRSREGPALCQDGCALLCGL
jgi:hypothetical protein